MERLTERAEVDFQCNDHECRMSYCDRGCGHYQLMVNKLAEYEDAEEQGLLLRLDSKDELIEVLAEKLLNSDFGRCYMCRNSMKNITLDGVNNGCDGMCNNEEVTVDDFLKKIVSEIEDKKRKAEQTLAGMKGE